jgi:hypothetical protein
VRRLTASNVMFRTPKVDIRELSTCQPQKGARVEVQEVVKSLDGIMGLDVAKVRVLEGSCAQQTGWVGLPKLDQIP